MHVRLTQIDGKLPNLALMRLASYHKSQGDTVHFTRGIERGLFEPEYGRVYGSVIFDFSHKRLAAFRQHFPEAVVGGTGSGSWQTVEDVIGDFPEQYDYSLYPGYKNSIGFLQRGCRLRCEFCVVPRKEGRPKAVMRVHDLYRGRPFPRKLHLLDNDFFGVPEWQEHIDDMAAGDFRVCFNQGINIRFITEEAAAALARVQYRDMAFKQRRLYTAWDSLKDERLFFRGVERLETAGIPPKHLMVYMLTGFDPEETWERIFYRFEKMTAMGIKPYPMVYDNSRLDLKRFQRWAVRGLYRAIPFKDYMAGHKADRNSAVTAPIW